MATLTGPVLLTGFEPFGGETANPSWQVAQALDGAKVGGARVVAARLPCAFGGALAALGDAIERRRPALVVGIGQATGRSDLSVERIAINVDDARIADNAGARPIDVPVVPGGPAAYFSTLPNKAIVAALHAAGLPASVSQTAGTFVCNHAFYGLMHMLAGRPGVRGGVVHLPLLPEQAVRHPGTASLPLATQVDGVRILIETALATEVDLRASGGSEG